MDAVWLTTELRVFGRDGRAGGSDVPVEVPLAADVVVGNAVAVEEDVVLPIRRQYRDQVEPTCAFLPAAPALSHGFGGETVLILRASAVHEVDSNGQSSSGCTY